jgi:HlyD family type I secretion membrane fusion protein
MVLDKMFSKGQQDDDTGVGGVVRFGLIAVIVGFGGFLAWAVFAPLTEGVIAQGTVTVDGKRKTIQHLEGGIVRAIYVKEGEQVKRGDVLVALDQTQIGAQKDLLLARYWAQLASLDRLQAERMNARDVVYSPELISDDDNARIMNLLEIQNSLFKARNDQLQGQTAILEQRVAQLERQVTGLQSERSAREQEISYITEELTRVEELHGQGLIGLPRLLEQKKALSKAEGAVGSIDAQIAAARVESGQAKLEILQLDLERKQEVAESILEAQELLFELREQLASTEDVLSRTMVKAPQSGTVLGLNVWTVGGVIPPGAALLEIVPDNRELVVEARVGLTDIDNVVEGLPARTRLLALKSRTTPDLNGTVENVSADALVDEATQESYYVARIAIPEEELALVGDDNIIPGMPVEVMIEAGQRTAMEYLTDPITDVVRRSMTED